MKYDCVRMSPPRLYADSTATYLVTIEEHETLNEEEIETAVMERFKIGTGWNQNKLEKLYPNHDGSIWTARIRIPNTN